MKNWKQYCVAPTATLLKTIEIIDKGAMQIALVVDDHGKLLGTVSDGDVRRGILKGVALQTAVSGIMNAAPLTVSVRDGRQAILDKMRSKDLRRIPIVDENGCVMGLQILEDLVLGQKKDNWVVLMAGGLGSRLRPLTDSVPKPLLQIGDKPLLETILTGFADQGFHRFFLSVNYKAEMIEAHFGDGSQWGVQIEYLHEKEATGTAGSLKLLPEKPVDPILVMNGDLLTKVNFHSLLDFHSQRGSLATMCIREYDFQVPYGVVRLEQERIVAIDEKPIQKFFVNAGIYALNPDVLDHIPAQTYFDMTTLFEALVAEKREVGVFPIREYWLDIGKLSDLERANGDFTKVFK